MSGRGRKVLLDCLIGVVSVVCLAGFSVVGYRVWCWWRDRSSVSETTEIRREIESEIVGDTSESYVTPMNGTESSEKKSEDVSVPENHVSDLSESAVARSRELLGRLREKYDNKDVVGYLVVDGSSIEYPIMQGETNDSYLKTNPYGDYEYNGSIFMDSDNIPDFLDSRTVVYGHNMINRSMFGGLRGLFEDSVEDRYFTVYSELGILRYKVLASSLVYAYGENYCLYPAREAMKEFESEGYTEEEIKRNRLEESEMSDFYKTLKENCLQWSDETEHDENSKILTLMTCYADGKSYRFAVSGVLQLPKGVLLARGQVKEEE